MNYCPAAIVLFAKLSKTRSFCRRLHGRGGVSNKALLCSAERVYKDVYTGLARSRDSTVQCIHGVFAKRTMAAGQHVLMMPQRIQ
jgi:hypothetical protein